MPIDRPAIAIVGAGVAGLVAADRLQREGFRITLVEARPRLGGRIHTQHDFAPIPIELGAEFVHGRHPELLGRITDAGLGLQQRRFQGLILKDGKEIPPAQSRERVFEELANPEARDIPIAGRIAELVESGAWSPTEAQVMRRYVEGYMAADVERASARALSEETRAAHEIDDEHNYSLREGYDALVAHLARRLHRPQAAVLMETSVRSVAWRTGAVTLGLRHEDGSDAGPLEAGRVILTVPLSVLQLPAGHPDAIRFEPEPVAALDAARALAMGNVVKLFFRWRMPIAELPGLNDEIRSRLASCTFLQTPDSAVPTWWKPCDTTSSVLVGWAGGPAADRLSGMSESEILAAGIETLSRALGSDAIASSVEAATVADWSRERWSRGAYSWIPAGALDAPSALAAPVEGTLFFAGEATDTAGYRGTVHGAMVTGLRAAQQVLDSVR